MGKKRATKSDWKNLRFAKQTVCVAGKGIKYEAKPADVKAWCKEEGAKVVDTVTADTDWLITVGLGFASSKKLVEKFNKQGSSISICDINALRKMLAPTGEEVHSFLSQGAAGRKRLGSLCYRSRAHSQGIQPKPGMNLKGCDLSGVEMEFLNLKSPDLRDAKFKGTKLGEITNGKLQKSEGEYFYVAKMVGCDCRNVVWPSFFLDGDGAKCLDSCDFSKADLTDGYFNYRGVHKCTFKQANLTKTDFEDCTLDSCDFTGANFSETQLTNTKIKGKTKFTGAKFHGADLSDVDFGDSDLSKADFSGARLTGTNFKRAKLAGANFKDAILINASFGNSDISKCKNLKLPTVTKVKAGPHCKTLTAAASKAAEMMISFTVNTSEGPISCKVHEHSEYGRRTTASYEIHEMVVSEEKTVNSAGFDYTFERENFKDRQEVKDMTAALTSMGQLWGHGEVEFDSIACKTKKSALKGKALIEAAKAAIGEVFKQEPPDEKVAKEKGKATRAKLSEQKAEIVAEMRGGKKGVTAFNKRDRDELTRLKLWQFRGEDFSGASMTGIELGKADLQKSDFSSANLSKATIRDGNCKDAKFVKANLTSIKLNSTNCRNCDFTSAKLTRSNLDFADLQNANLQKADLTGASMWCTYLQGADLTGVHLDKVKKFDSVLFDLKTKFPSGFVIPEDAEFMGAGIDPRSEKAGKVIPVAAVGGFDDFMLRMESCVESSRLKKAMKMLKSERFQLFSDVDDHQCVGIVKSQSDPDLVYSCRLNDAGQFSCCTQNLNPCGGLRGALCKHLLVLMVGLAKGEQIDAQTAATWVDASQQAKPKLDKDEMAEVLLKYKGVEAGDVDWRPTETIPEDFMTY